jgi:Bucentaur or craniofacial development
MSKRKSVDEAFYRMYQYTWGESFSLEPGTCDDFDRELIRIFGRSMAAKISAGKRRKLLTKNRSNNKHSVLSSSFPSSETTLTELKYPTSLDTMQHPAPPHPVTASSSASVVSSTKTTSTGSKSGGAPTVAVSKPKSGIDAVLAQIAEPTKTSTVKKTSDDWESFKESDKQLQDELEKKAQSKDALLVRQDFLVRVDNRKFEIEKEERDRERARRGMNK